MSSKSDVAVSVRGLSKAYTIAHNDERHVTLAEQMLHRVRNPFKKAQTETFWALRDVEFDIKKGDVVGIIGRNGAGKSTLLKILSRITEPTDGEIRLYGRVGSLLEVGTGFHPELTGRENVYLNGQILGMRKREIDKQFDAIVDFAGVEKFLDTPVKRYSSGMYVRLAFAVAAHLQTEILIVDEVLAVGDTEFQRKCLGKIQDVAHDGRTVLFVSHNMGAIQMLCTSALLLKRGELVAVAKPEECIATYFSRDEGGRTTIVSHGKPKVDFIKISRILVNGSEDDQLELPVAARELKIEVQGVTTKQAKLDIEGYLLDSTGVRLGQFSPTRFNGNLENVGPGAFCLTSVLRLPALNRGQYCLDLLLNHPMIEGYWEFSQALKLIIFGRPLFNGSVLESSSSGSLLIDSTTSYAAMATPEERVT